MLLLLLGLWLLGLALPAWGDRTTTTTTTTTPGGIQVAPLLVPGGWQDRMDQLLPPTTTTNASQADMLPVLGRSGRVWVRLGTTALGEWVPLPVPSEETSASILRSACSGSRCYLLDRNPSRLYHYEASSSSGRAGGGDKQGPPLVHALPLPLPYNTLGMPVLAHHPAHPDWLAFTGMQGDCSNPASPCYTVTFATKDHGASWRRVSAWTLHCAWAAQAGGSVLLLDDDLYCTEFRHKPENASMDAALREREAAAGTADPSNPVQLALFPWQERDGLPSAASASPPTSASSSSSSLDAPRHVLVPEGVLDFELVDSQLVLAVQRNGSQSLLLSTDGVTMHPATFAPALRAAGSNLAFTTLSSPSGGGVLVHVTSPPLASSGERPGDLYLSGAVHGHGSATQLRRVLANAHSRASGVVEVARPTSLPGLLLANVVITENPASAPSATARTRTRLSRDLGATWGALEDEHQTPLHLHLPASLAAPQDPSLLLGVGNVGPHLLSYAQGHLYRSRDAGRTWRQVHDGPCLWALSQDTATLVVAREEGLVEQLAYSHDLGATWHDYRLPVLWPVRVERLQVQGPHFLVYGHAMNGSDIVGVALALDFGALVPKTCGPEDLESWSPTSSNGSGSSTATDGCVLGARISVQRRKPEATCRLGDVSTQPPVPLTTQPCTCTEADFACDFGHIRAADGRTCTWDGVTPLPCVGEGEARRNQSSGYLRIPLNQCVGGVDRSGPLACAAQAPAPVEGRGGAPAEDGAARVTIAPLPDALSEYYAFRDGRHVLLKDVAGHVWWSGDAGVSWTPTPYKDEVFLEVHVDEKLAEGRAFLVSAAHVYVTLDRGTTWAELRVPAPSGLSLVDEILRPHPTHADWLLYVGMQDCTFVGKACHTQAYLSHNGGGAWSPFATYVSSCDWARASPTFSPSLAEDAVFCVRYDVSDGNQLADSVAWSKHLVYYARPTAPAPVLVVEAEAFAIVDEYMLSSVLRGPSSLSVTLNGRDWERATFLPNGGGGGGGESSTEPAYPDHGYTALDSSSGHLILSRLMDARVGAEYGALFRSNWNGTTFHSVLAAINQDAGGYVDFERIKAVPGMLLANVVANVPELPAHPKRLQTRWTLDDGLHWRPLPRPQLPSGEPVPCPEGEADCTLHLHAYTARRDRRDLYTHPATPWLLVGTGAVGTALPDVPAAAHTFLSRDAGVSWTQVLDAPYMHEVGHHGDVVLFAKDSEPVDTLMYTLDQGLTFRTLRLPLDGGKLRVSNLFAVPSSTGDTSAAIFHVFGLGVGGARNDRPLVLTVDLTRALGDRPCAMVAGDAETADYEDWEVPGFGVRACPAGARTMYRRRKRDIQCRSAPLPPPVVRPCECTYADWECEDGYVRQEGDGRCVLPPGQAPPTFPCLEGVQRLTRGYRKLRGDVCTGGPESEVEASTRSCTMPGDWSKFAGTGRGVGGSPRSSVLWMVLLTGGLMVLLVYGYREVSSSRKVGGRGRYGPVQLPMLDGDFAEGQEEDGLGGEGRSPLTRAWLAVEVGARRLYHAGRELAEGALEQGHDLYLWLRTRRRGHRQYSPIPVFYAPSSEDHVSGAGGGSATVLSSASGPGAADRGIGTASSGRETLIL